jgi:hypothetical protein
MVANKLFKTLQEIPWKGQLLTFITACHIFIICCNYTVYRPLGVYDSIGLRFTRYTLYLGNSGAIICLAFNGRLTFHGPVVTLCTASLTFSNSTFCPHGVFTCFVWIWEQTAIISLYSINWLGFLTETECVYCAVRTGCLNTVPGITNLQRLNAKRNVQTWHGRPTAHSNVQPMTTPPDHIAQLH